MNYNILPSLEDIALIKVAISLWNPDDIRALMRRLSFSVHSQALVSDRGVCWELDSRVFEKIPHLLLHIHLQEKLETFVKIIGLQILHWLEYHFDFFCTDVLNEFCWTPQGTIDCKKTAEILIKDENIDINSRYILACVYCLQEDIEKLWKKMRENRTEYFYRVGDPRAVHKLVVLWTCFMKGDFVTIRSIFGSELSPDQYAFEVSVAGGITAATEYFLPKLTSRQREESLSRSALRYAWRKIEIIERKLDIPTQCMDFLCYLLSQMNELQQRELIKSYTHSVLYCFIHWPRQPLLMEMAKRAWDFLTEDDYDNLLCNIRDKFVNKYNDVNYRELFAEFWQQSHDNHKKFVIDSQHDNYIIADFFF